MSAESKEKFYEDYCGILTRIANRDFHISPAVRKALVHLYMTLSSVRIILQRGSANNIAITQTCGHRDIILGRSMCVSRVSRH